MNTIRLGLAVIARVVFVSLLSIWYYPSKHDYAMSNPAWNGLHEFNQHFATIPVDNLDALLELPADATLVVIPVVDYLPAELEQLLLFVDGGGRLLLLDDYGYGNRILESFELEVRFWEWPLLDGLFNYGNQWLPNVRNLSPQLASQGVQTVLLNHATGLNGTRTESVIARSSSVSYIDVVPDEVFFDTEDILGPHPVAVKERYGQGHIYVAADPSVLINGMLTLDDNLAFVEFMVNGGDAETVVAVDRGHLSDQGLEISKDRLSEARSVLVDPYTQVGIMALIVVTAAVFTLKNEEVID